MMSPGTAHTVVQGFEVQLTHLQDEYAKQLLHQQAVQDTANDQHAAAAGANILQDTQAGMHDQQTNSGAAGDAAMQAQPHGAMQPGSAEAAATVMLAAAQGHQQRIKEMPMHKRAFEALIAAAAVTEEAEAAASSDGGVPRPRTKKQRRSRAKPAAAAAAPAGAAPGAAVDALAFVAVPEGQVATGAAAAAQGAGDDAEAVVKVGRLAEAVAAALAAAAGGQADATGQTPAAAAAFAADAADDAAQGAADQQQYAAGYGWDGSWAGDGSWDGTGFSAAAAAAGGGEFEDGEEGGLDGQQRAVDPERALKKRLAASESYKRKKEQEVQLNAYWTSLQVGVTPGSVLRVFRVQPAHCCHVMYVLSSDS
jgi:hypothetical protein